MATLAATVIVSVLALCIVHGMTRAAVALHRAGKEACER